MSHTDDTNMKVVRELACKLLDAAVGPHSHAVVMEALLAAYMSVAKAHPCCTQAAANGAMSASIQLAIAATARPAGTPVH
jgi:hypothetical protein